ncbi:hypothetical protein THAOC_32214, partial [Thalassiosira oceanica]
GGARRGGAVLAEIERRESDWAEADSSSRASTAGSDGVAGTGPGRSTGDARFPIDAAGPACSASDAADAAGSSAGASLSEYPRRARVFASVMEGVGRGVEDFVGMPRAAATAAPPYQQDNVLALRLVRASASLFDAENRGRKCVESVAGVDKIGAGVEASSTEWGRNAKQFAHSEFTVGLATREQYASEALSGYQDAVEEMKSHGRDEAKNTMRGSPLVASRVIEPSFRRLFDVYLDGSSLRRCDKASS